MAQPLDEVEYHGVAPHPGGKTLETAERLVGILVITEAAYIAIDAEGVGPVGFDGHGVEAFFLDQAFGNLSALAIELMRSVRRFAEQTKTRRADKLEKQIVIGRRAFDRLCGFLNDTAGQSDFCYGHKSRGVLSYGSVFSLSSFEQLTHFLVSSLRKVSIPFTHPHKWLGRGGANNFVRAHLILITGLWRRHRHGDDDARGILLAKSGCGCAHRGTGGQAVIDEDYGLTPHVGFRTRATISALAALQLPQFINRHGVDHFTRNSEVIHYLPIENAHAA